MRASSGSSSLLQQLYVSGSVLLGTAEQLIVLDVHSLYRTIKRSEYMQIKQMFFFSVRMFRKLETCLVEYKYSKQYDI